MNNILKSNSSIILPKDVVLTDVPYSSDVDYLTFSRVLSDSAASYKMYWLLSLIEEVSRGKTEIDFKTMAVNMIVYAWYPIVTYKLSFGYCDNLSKVISYIEENYGLAHNCEKSKLFDFIYNNQDSNLNRMIKNLTCDVPYRFLSPFFRDKIRSIKKPQSVIEKLSTESTNCVYSINADQNNNKYIRLNKNWAEYLKNNYKLIKGWSYYKLICFIQKRNPNTPAIAMKLDAPAERNLRLQTKIWKEIIDDKHITDLYTGLPYNKDNFERYGNLSIDHFVPWNFVLHDMMWNLIPCFKNINSKKSDNLLNYDNYITGFAKDQYIAFCHVVDKNYTSIVEEYRDALKIEDAKKFRLDNERDKFCNILKKQIHPLFNIAENQGYEIMDVI